MMENQKTIVNPKTGRSVSVDGNIGKRIIKHIQSGKAFDQDTDRWVKPIVAQKRTNSAPLPNPFGPAKSQQTSVAQLHPNKKPKCITHSAAAEKKSKKLGPQQPQTPDRIHDNSSKPNNQAAVTQSSSKERERPPQRASAKAAMSMMHVEHLHWPQTKMKASTETAYYFVNNLLDGGYVLKGDMLPLFKAWQDSQETKSLSQLDNMIRKDLMTNGVQSKTVHSHGRKKYLDTVNHLHQKTTGKSIDWDQVEFVPPKKDDEDRITKYAQQYAALFESTDQEENLENDEADSESEEDGDSEVESFVVEDDVVE